MGENTVSEKTNQTLTLTMLQEAVAGTAAAFRCIARLEPAGGPGDKIFPPTYEGGQYATEERRINGEVLPCVLLDSVQSQTNRMELALLDAWERKPIPLPVISVDFVSAGLTEVGEITSLEAPHRIADAILRDSRYEDRPFRQSSFGKKLNTMTPRNATALFELCPTALLFGLWDSTGPKGGAGAKFARAMVSEIIGINAQPGMKTSSRIDPLGIMLQAGPLYQARGGGWTLRSRRGDSRKEQPRQTWHRWQAIRGQPRQRDAHDCRRRVHHRQGDPDYRRVAPRAAPPAFPDQWQARRSRGSRSADGVGSSGAVRGGADKGAGLRSAITVPTPCDGAGGMGDDRRAGRTCCGLFAFGQTGM